MKYKDLLIDALKTFSQKPENIENFSRYLDYHFAKWVDTFAKNPENFIFELYHFANMEV